MQKYFKIPFLAVLILAAMPVKSQICGHDIVEAEVQRLDPNHQADFDEFISTIDFDSDNKTEGTVYTIPVVVHIIWDTQSDNITDKQVKNALEVINEDYRRMNADKVNTRSIFTGVAADCEIEFRLAKLDPNGNCTTGITRTQSALSVNANNNVKGLISWPRTKYLNIWVVNSIDLGGQTAGTVLGYAYKPSAGQSTTYDGIVIRHDRMGRIGTSSSQGRTLTHESGHYLGLDHPFNGGCFSGDNCADTPPVLEASYGCDQTANSCSNDNPNLPDQIENYMDYADDNCMNMFTDDQKAIMRGSLTNATKRGYLVTSTNLAGTGIDPTAVLPCAPEALFKADQTVFCKGTTVQYTDMSEWGNPTSWEWTFQGGNPASSTAENPTVSYANPGVYNTKLVVTNATGSSTLLQEGYVSVRDNSNYMWVNGFNSGFEFVDIPNGTWHVDNPDGDAIKWTRNSYNHFEGSYCVKLDNFNNDPFNSDALITDKIVVNRAKALSFNFRYAVASQPSGSMDKLQVSVSQDCGATWESVRTILGPMLYAATNKSTPWNPTATSHWRAANVNLSDYVGNAPIMVKVDFINGGGNNAFLDAFELAVTLDQEDLTAQNINIYPNPSNGTFHVDGLPAGTNYSIYGVDGREVQRGQLDLDGSLQLNAAAGYYFFQAEQIRKPIILQ
jgi:hypothetical protein